MSPVTGGNRGIREVDARRSSYLGPVRAPRWWLNNVFAVACSLSLVRSSVSDPSICAALASGSLLQTL